MLEPSVRRVLLAFGVGGLTLLGFSRPSEAQSSSGRAVAVVGGMAQYDLSGTGTIGFMGTRIELPVGRFVIVEPALTYSRYTPQFSDVATSLLFPEVQLQAQMPTRLVRPFVGVGIGPAFAWDAGQSDTDLSLSGGAGARFRLSELWGARAELRVRAIDPFHGSIVEWTVGFARGF